MDLKQFVWVLRANWMLVAFSVLVCAGAAGALAWTRTPIYEARTQLFVSTTESGDLSQTYQGGLFFQQRVRSYAQIVSSPPVAEAVSRQLGLPGSVERVQDAIRASVPIDSVLINVTVKDRSPTLAKTIADAVGNQFPGFINTLERPRRGQGSPVKVSVTSPARLPSDPVSPRKPLYLALGTLLGLFLGIGGAVLRETFGKRIRSDDEAAAITGAPVLGRIAEYRAKKRPVIVVDDPVSAGAEGYRRLRANLRALSIENGLKSIVVSSAVASEGKTLTVANLGVVFAQAGHRVTLVDADLRRPRLAEVLGLDSPEGLSNVLIDNLPVERALHRPTELPLEVLASGPPLAYSSELLGSELFASVLGTLEKRADLVILDTPALLSVADAVVLSQLASAVILVARVASTRADQLKTAAQSLRAVDSDVLGVVLNRLPARDHRPYG